MERKLSEGFTRDKRNSSEKKFAQNSLKNILKVRWKFGENLSFQGGFNFFDPLKVRSFC